MVKCLKLKKQYGETARRYLDKQGCLDKTRIVGKTMRYLLLPLTSKFKKTMLLKKFPGASIEERALQTAPATAGNLKALLKGVIPNRHIEKVVRSFDVIGDIAIIDIPPALKKLETSIAWTLKRAHPYIKVIAKKTGKIEKEYRTRPLEILTGEKRTTTMYKEAGVMLHLDLAKVYFSPRLASERLRITAQVQPREKILTMFAGVGPYPLVITKKQPSVKIWAIEINPVAFDYLKENIRINKVGHLITPILGDVNKVVPEIGEVYDRIIMPYPEHAWDFLNLALKFAAPDAIVHLYAFIHEDEVKAAIDKIKKIAKQNKKKIKVLRWIRTGSYAARTYRFCIDFKVKI